MWPFIRPIKLIRYLLVWRINSSLVWLPGFPSAELSLVLGNIIADRLPTRAARPWRKALAPWDTIAPTIGKKQTKRPPDASWPLESVLFVYPSKPTWGEGELILWELKLMGESADHGLFLEVILPALEEAGSTSDPRWRRQNSIWGQFDVYSVYAARGAQWEPVAQAGQLDLSYRATPEQWAEGLSFEVPSERTFDSLTWLTPFDLDIGSGRRKKIPPGEVPGLWGIVDALLERMGQLLPGKYTTADDVWAALGDEERERLREAFGQAALIPRRHHRLTQSPKGWPGRWMGEQVFASIPHSLIPYLELASILHIGKQTHLGCGTFDIT